MDFTTVVILISDENENASVFNPLYYNVSISEDIVVGRELLRIQSVDHDSSTNGALTYSIESGNENFAFFLDESKESLYLATELDHENVSR